jgi:hypothetical protein
MLRRHNRALHGTGVLAGLEVTLEDASGSLVVGPGIAIGREGELLVVECPIRMPAPTPREGAGAPVLVELAFAEHPFAPVPVGDGEEFSRIREDVEVRVCEEPGDGVVIARLLRSGDGWSVDRA